MPAAESLRCEAVNVKGGCGVFPAVSVFPLEV